MADLDISLFWDDSPDLWDTLHVGGSALPGIASVSATHGRKLDTKSAPGTNGARIIDKGYQPAKVEITVKLWTKEQLDTWFRLAPTLTYRREPQSSARADAAPAATPGKAAVPKSQQDAAAKLTAKEHAAVSERASTRARSLERHDFEVSHPALDTIQVRRVYIEEVSTPNPSGKGVYEVKIKAIESKAPRESRTRTVSSSAGQGSASIPTAFNASSPTSTGAAAP